MRLPQGRDSRAHESGTQGPPDNGTGLSSCPEHDGSIRLSPFHFIPPLGDADGEKTGPPRPAPAPRSHALPVRLRRQGMVQESSATPEHALHHRTPGNAPQSRIVPSKEQGRPILRFPTCVSCAGGWIAARPKRAAAPRGTGQAAPGEAQCLQNMRALVFLKAWQNSVVIPTGEGSLPGTAPGNDWLCRRTRDAVPFMQRFRTSASVTAPSRECNRSRLTTLRNSRIFPGQSWLQSASSTLRDSWGGSIDHERQIA